MTDGENYIRNLSDSELERFVGLNRNMYTKPELHIADDEMAKRKRARAAKAAQPPTPQPQAKKAEPASPPTSAVTIPAVEFHVNDFVIPDVKIPELPKLEELTPVEVKPETTKPETAKPDAMEPEAAKPQAPKPEEPVRPAQAVKPTQIAAASKRNYTMPNAGAPAVPDEPTSNKVFMFCTTCGRKVSLDAEYCTNCGNRVSLNDVLEKEKPVRPKTTVYYGPSSRAYRSNMDCCGNDECG